MANHTIDDIESAASALANQLSAGINLREAVGRMVRLQPRHADMWATAAESLSRGGRLSATLEAHWPEGVVAALKAGEESGSLQEVMKRTAASMQVKNTVKKIWGKLMSPVIALLAGFGVLMFFMVAVIPKLAASMGGGEESFVLKASVLTSKVVLGYWPLLIAALAGLAFAARQWLKAPGNIDRVIMTGDRIPVLGEALRNLYFGMWAYQMAMLDAAGLPARQQLTLSARTLPEGYRDGVMLMASECEKRGLAESSDPDKQPEDDPRRAWPFYISTAFAIAHETGRIDQEMQRCAPILIDEGIKKLTKAAGVADLGAKVAAAVMIGLPLLGYFTQMSNSLTKSFS